MLLTKARGLEEPALHQVLQRAGVEVTRASEVVRRLRGYAKPNDGLMRPALLNAIIEEAAALRTMATGSCDIQVVLDHCCPTTLVVVDRTGIQLVLLNLIRNACEAMAGQERRELRIESRLCSNLVEIRVSDTGTGIDPDLRDRLFEAFTTTKADGMGIGLSICNKIVGAHGGKLWTEPLPGGGTVFIFTLQLAPPDTLTTLLPAAKP